MRRLVISSLYISILLFSCNSKIYVLSNIDLKEGENALNKLACKIKNDKNNEFYFRKIIWNDSVSCGLLDVSFNTEGVIYYPFLVTKEQEVISLIPFNSKKVEYDKINIDDVYLKFKSSHINLFTKYEFEVMRTRLAKKVVNIGFSSLQSNVFTGDTDILDSLYLPRLNNKYIFYCKKK
jgi:hypothetical protein